MKLPVLQVSSQGRPQAWRWRPENQAGQKGKTEQGEGPWTKSQAGELNQFIVESTEGEEQMGESSGVCCVSHRVLP